MPHKPVYQRAKLSLSVGRRVQLDIGLKLTSTGLVAIGTLVSCILLSTAVLVRTSVREAQPPARR